MREKEKRTTLLAKRLYDQLLQLQSQEGHLVALIEDRWMSWKVLRLMIIAAKNSGTLLELLAEAQLNSLVGSGDIELIYKSPISTFFLKRLFAFIACELEVSTDNLRDLVFGTTLSGEYIFFLATHGYGEDTINLGDEERSRQVWNSVIKSFWSSNKMQKVLYTISRRYHWFRIGVLTYGLDALCHRKDRKMFEILIEMEPNAFAQLDLDGIISRLERTRGKTERIIYCIEQFRSRH